MWLDLKQRSENDLARYARDGVGEDELDMPGGNLGGMGVAGAMAAMSAMGMPGLQEMSRWLEERKKSTPNDPMFGQMEMARQHVAAQLANLGYLPPGGAEVGEDLGYGPARALAGGNGELCGISQRAGPRAAFRALRS
jgi:hypothetical protein